MAVGLGAVHFSQAVSDAAVRAAVAIKNGGEVAAHEMYLIIRAIAAIRLREALNEMAHAARMLVEGA